MHPDANRSPQHRRQAGFSLMELMIASTAFVIIMSAAMTMMVQWQRVNGRAEDDINSINQAAKAIGQIADDVRMATYIYHYATISIEQSGVSAFKYRNNPETFANIGIVTQGKTADGLPNTFFTNRNVDTSMMGIESTGTCSILAMITDQPYGLNRPRYILYWVGPAGSTLKARTERTEGDLSVYPLYRLEASPSSNVAMASPTSWYSFKDPIGTTCATSGIYLTLQANNVGTIQDFWSNGVRKNTVNIGYKVTKAADIVMGPDVPGPFTLHNEHPFSNASLLSPYSAIISLSTSRVGSNGSLRKGNVDLYTLSTSAFARNIPLPQI
ncbi:MAG TPA: prepilin-type N-terminal cleavage/methylation domain-containing protein [Stenomitos sp.]